MTIEIAVKNKTFLADLYQLPTALSIWNALPLEGKSTLWGDEIYFEVPVSVNLAPEAREVVEVGDLAIWPDGNVFCIFFGPTPVSTGNKPQAISPVNVFGHIKGDLSGLKEVQQGDLIRVKKHQE